MIKEAIGKVVEGVDLTETEMVSVTEEIMTGAADTAQIGAFLTALRIKGETVAEITGAAQVMRAKATVIKTPGIEKTDIVDTCGTGGDGSNTFNISTASAFVTAGAGVTVAKHGNRSVSSKSGSADVLRSLGVNVEAEVKCVESCIQEAGIGFLFAPLLHGAMKYAAPVRRSLGIRTIFNVLGPLTNPAGARCQLIGVYDPRLTEILASVLNNLGTKRALVVRGEDGLDEITLTTETKVTELSGSNMRTYMIKPEDFDLERCLPADLLGGDSVENAAILLQILKGSKGAKTDIVLLNSAAALFAAGKADSIEKSVGLARESIGSGEALKRLEQLKEITNV